MSTELIESITRGDASSVQEAIIEAEAKQRSLVLTEALSRLKKLEEGADWFGRVVDMSDISNFGDEGRPFFVMDRQMAEGRAMVYPGATACAYINESELRLLRARSRAFVLGNPYWLGVAHSRRVYTVGSGHAYKVVPKKDDKSDETKTLCTQVMDEIDLFRKVNRYRKRQKEKVTRLDRDGEFFIRYHEDNADGVLRIRFIEPLLVWTPPGKSTADDVWFGIQFNGDYEDPQGYWIRSANYLGNTKGGGTSGYEYVESADIQHRTANVDMSSPRGLPTTYALQTRLDQALKTLSNTGAIVEFRARIALIRKHVNATASSIRTMLDQNATGQRPTAGGQMANAYQLPQAAILDTNDQTTYEFPTNDTQVDKIVASIQAELRSVAAALGMAEYMVSADASNANFSSTMVAEGSPVKTFEGMQADMIDDDMEVLERAMEVAITNGRLPKDTLDKVKIEAEPPVIVSRNRLEETQADEILNRNHTMSVKTWRARNDLDNDSEEQQIEMERDAAAAYTMDQFGGQGQVDPDTGVPTTLKPDKATDWLGGNDDSQATASKKPTKEEIELNEFVRIQLGERGLKQLGGGELVVEK